MLGQVLPVDARRGLNIFLSRGMWTWACTQAVADPQSALISTASPLQDHPFERSTIIHALVGIVMTINERRTA